MSQGTKETRSQCLITVPGKEYAIAFWPADVRFLEGMERGCRIHLFTGEDSQTLFTPLSVADVINAIQEITDPPFVPSGIGLTRSHWTGVKMEVSPRVDFAALSAERGPITVTICDSQTEQRIVSQDHDWYWWTQGMGRYDPARGAYFGEDPWLHTQELFQRQRYIIVDSDHGRLDMLNQGYPLNLLARFGVPIEVQP